jgi:predicted dithiol-disulfide oxidoreductase (DUF899 family)
MATFLIVDDNKTATNALCALVERRGHTSYAAYDGEEALHGYFLVKRAIDSTWAVWGNISMTPAARRR